MVPQLYGRTANAIKNRFNATLLPRIRQAGRTLAKTNLGIFERDVNGAPIGIPVLEVLEVLPASLLARTCLSRANMSEAITGAAADVKHELFKLKTQDPMVHETHPYLLTRLDGKKRWFHSSKCEYWKDRTHMHAYARAHTHNHTHTRRHTREATLLRV